MKSMLGRGKDVGRHPFSHTSSSGGEEFEGHGVAPSRRERLASKRAAAKLMSAAAARATNSRKRLRARTPGESDSSEEEADEAVEPDEANEANGSEDDEEEAEAFAPSGKARVGKVSKKRSATKYPYKTTVRGYGIRGRQTGRVGRSIPSSRVATRFESRKRRRTDAEEDEMSNDDDNQEVAWLEASSSVDASESEHALTNDIKAEDVEDAAANDEADDSSDDEVYRVLDYMSDSDEDDADVEQIEEAAIIVEEEMQTVTDPLGIGFADFTIDLDLSSYLQANQNELGLTDFTDFPANFNWAEPESVETTDVMPPSTVPTAPVSTVASPRPVQDQPAVTGLQTPTSLKRPMDLDEDGEETEEEKDNKPSFVNVSNLKFPMGSMSAPPKPRKAKKPKLGSFEISRKDICMYHDDSKKLIMVGGRKVKKSGYNTPKGIIPLDPRKGTPPSEAPTTPVQPILAHIDTSVMGQGSSVYSPFDTPLAASSLGDHDELTNFNGAETFDGMKGLINPGIGAIIQANAASHTLLSSDFDLFDNFNDFVQL